MGASALPRYRERDLTFNIALLNGLLRFASDRWLSPTVISCTTLIRSPGVFKGAFGNEAVTDPEHVTNQEHILAQVRRYVCPSACYH